MVAMKMMESDAVTILTPARWWWWFWRFILSWDVFILQLPPGITHSFAPGNRPGSPGCDRLKLADDAPVGRKRVQVAGV